MKYRILRLAFLAIFSAMPAFAQQTQSSQTQPLNQSSDKPAAQPQTAQTQSIATSQTQASQTQSLDITILRVYEVWPREFTLTIGASAVSSLQPWNSPTKQNDRIATTGFTTGAGMRDATGFAVGQITLAPKNPNGYFGTEISAGKTLRKIGGIGFGAGIRYWYANQKQEVLANNFWKVYAADRWHAGFLSINAVFGKFNGSNARVSVLVGSAYASTTAEIYSNGKKVGVGQLQKAFIPAYGGEISGKLWTSEKLALTGSVLYIGAPPMDLSGRQNTVIPRTNVFLAFGADYILPFRLIGKTTGVGIKSTLYLSEQEIPIVKRGIAISFFVRP